MSRMLFFILALFLTTQAAQSQTVDVSSYYNGIPEEGGGVIVGFGKRRFIFTVSHLSQGNNLNIKINHNPLASNQILGQLSYNEYDFEMFEVTPESTPQIQVEWDPNRDEFYSVINYSQNSPQPGANPFINLTPTFATKSNPVILVFNSKYDFSNRYSEEAYKKEHVQRLPIIYSTRGLIQSDITKQFISDTPLFPGASGNPVYKRLSPQDRKDTFMGLASATDSLSSRSYYTDRSIIKEVFKIYLSGRMGSLGTAKWIISTKEPYDLYRTFTSPILVSEVEGKMLRGSTGRANRGQTGRANRGQTGSTQATDEFVFDYDVLASGQGLTYQGRRAIGFRYNGVNLEANFASYYWLKGKAYEVIWQDEPDKNKSMAINYINIKDGQLKLRWVSMKTLGSEDMFMIYRSGNILVIYDTLWGTGKQIDLSRTKLKDILFIPFTHITAPVKIDLRSLFLFDISANNSNFSVDELKKTRIVRFLSNNSKDIDDFFRTYSFYAEEQ